MANITIVKKSWSIHTPGRRQLKTLILSTNVDKKLLETEFLIAICRQTGNKWQSKTLFLAVFDPCLLIVKSVLDCQLPGVIHMSQHSVKFDVMEHSKG